MTVHGNSPDVIEQAFRLLDSLSLTGDNEGAMIAAGGVNVRT